MNYKALNIIQIQNHFAKRSYAFIGTSNIWIKTEVRTPTQNMYLIFKHFLIYISLI